MKEEITIILCTFNRCELLKDALSSVLKQTYKNFKVMVCDNASTDGTVNYMNKISEQDERIFYNRREKNIGSALNFQYALDACDTEFFMFMTDDDIMHSELIEKEMDFMNKHKEVALVGTACLFLDKFGNNLPYKPIKLFQDYKVWEAGDYFHQELRNSKIQILMSGFLARREEVWNAQKRMAETDDCGWFEKISQAGYKLAMLSEPLYYYRISNEGGNAREVFNNIEILNERLETRKGNAEISERADNYEYAFDTVNECFLSQRSTFNKKTEIMVKMIKYTQHWLKDIKKDGIELCLCRPVFQSKDVIEHIYLLSLILEVGWVCDYKIDETINNIKKWMEILKNKAIVLEKLQTYSKISIFGTDFNSLALTQFLQTINLTAAVYYDNNYADDMQPNFRAKIINPSSDVINKNEIIIISNLNIKSVESIKKQLMGMNQEVKIVWWEDLNE